MAKIRVYELARDLNLTNQDLVDKISDLGIEVSSHMSSLDDEAVASIKAGIFGKKKEKLDEVRIKPTVIRRRKKAKAKKPDVEEVDVEAEISAATDVEPEEEIVAEQQEAIQQIEEPAEKETAAKKTKEKTEVKDDKKKGKKDAAASKKTALKPKKKAAKPKKKEVAAKIIKLPTVPVQEKLLKKKKAKIGKEQVLKIKEVEPVVQPPPSDKLDKKGKKKGAKVKPEEVEKVGKVFKKKSGFRRKSIIEGEELYDRGIRSRKGRKSGKAKAATGQKTEITTSKAIKRRIKIDESIFLSELAKRMGIKAGELIQSLMNMGVMATVNQALDFDTAVLVAGEFNYELERAAFEEDLLIKKEEDDPGKMVERPPVVTIMGHVDHGKTSLLDVIRETKVADGESGGITQHIGAYHVSTSKGQIVFLDTPGHEAFTAMRSRGSKITDLVVLVVAADDGVMPQTTEAINHSRAAEVPIIVAINKIDKDNADPERVQRELSDAGLVSEEWGGDTIFVKVSAKKNEGINELLEMILLQAEVLELKANPEKPASGHVVEAKLDAGKGPVATVLIQGGTLHVSDMVVCGVHYGKVRTLLDDIGREVKTAGPSMPVEVVGISGVPMAGDELMVIADEKNARQVSLHRSEKQRSKDLTRPGKISLENLYEHIQEGGIKELNLILKADVHGSIEAINDSLQKLSNIEVKINIVHSATGTITESDVSLGAVSNAIIVGFNVRPSARVQDMADEENVDMRFYTVIYDLIKDLKDSVLGMMASTFEERILGRAEVREVFHVPKIGAIAGSYVTDGKIERGSLLRLIREGVILYEGRNSSLRRFKDDAKEVQSGYECGIGIENYNDIKVGDTIECYYLEEIKPVLKD
ncbi:MAG: translation initiation factor IF-2 [Deltaproteobacteria bacterium]|nr:translation initiation factor IF-2 [Deltaproteobacteria bacterium]